MGSLLVLALLLARLPLVGVRQPAVEPSQIETVKERLDSAEALLERNSPAPALEILRPVLAEVSESADRTLLLRALHHMGWAESQRNEYASALTHYGRALALSRELTDQAFEARILRGLAVVHKDRGAHAEALRHGHDAVKLFETLGDRGGAGRSWNTIGSALDVMGDYRGALEAYQQAKTLLEGSQDRAFFILLNNIAITYKNLGNYQEALSYYARALAGHRGIGDMYGQAVTLLNTGVVYRWLGQPERAIDNYEQSLALIRLLNERRGLGFALGNLADAWAQLGDLERAVGYVEQQLALAREMGNRVLAGEALKQLGDLRLALGNRTLARQHLEAALAVQREIGAQARAGEALVSLSGLSRLEGQTATARVLAEQALALGVQTESPELEWQARLALARAARREDGEAALGQLRTSVEIINSLRGRVLTDAGKIGYMDSRQEAFHELVDLLEEQQQPAASLEVAEAARSRALADLLAGREITLRPAEAASLAAVREGEARLRAQGRLNTTDDTLRAELTRTRGATEADLTTRVRRLEHEQPELASLVTAEPVSFEAITATSRRLRATLVEYLVTEKRLFIWVVSPQGVIRSAAVEITRPKLRQMVQGLHQSLTSLDLAALRDPRPVRQALAALYRVTLGPVARHLPRDHGALVYVIPHDALFLVPFAALVDGSGRYLAERHTWVSAPSIGVLRYTAEKKRRVFSPDRPHFMAVADPRPPEDAGFGALPGTREEARRISRRFPPARSMLLLGEQASEAAGKRLAPGQTLLHLAVHGSVYDDRPLDSALVLSPGDGEDGWLRVREVFGLDLRTDVVVLSGCSTGLGKLSGDGVLGLSRAFLYAGTPSVVVSLWDVSDVATAYFMDRFYAGLGAGRGKADSLRQAQLLTLRRYPHPALWSAFVLVGEPR